MPLTAYLAPVATEIPFACCRQKKPNSQLFSIELSLNWCHRKEFSTLRHLMLNFIEGITRFVLLGIWIYSYTPSVWRSKYEATSVSCVLSPQFSMLKCLSESASFFFADKFSDFQLWFWLGKVFDRWILLLILIQPVDVRVIALGRSLVNCNVYLLKFRTEFYARRYLFRFVLIPSISVKSSSNALLKGQKRALKHIAEVFWLRAFFC